MSELKIEQIETELEIVSFYDLPVEVQNEKKDNYDEVEDSSFFLYREHYYDLNDFMRIENSTSFKGYHGYHSETYFSGILIKLTDGGETVTAASYYS